MADQVLEFVALNDQRDMLAIARGLIQVVRKLREQEYAMLLVEQTVQLALSVSVYPYGMSHGRIEIKAKQDYCAQWRAFAMPFWESDRIE